jgi:hypothetical protein
MWLIRRKNRMKVKNENVFVMSQTGMFEKMRSLKLSIVDAYNVLKILDAITPILKRTQNANANILQEIGFVQGATPTEEQENIYREKFQELMGIEDDIEIEKIPLSILINAKMECSADEIRVINWLIDMDK